MIRAAAFIALAVGGLASSPPAAAMSGKELLANCAEVLRRADDASSVNPYEAGRCVGYVDGFGEGTKVSALGASSNLEEYQKRRFFCVPEGVTNLQIVRMLVAALRDQSEERLQEDAGVLVGIALRQAYPCAAGAGKSD